MCVFNFFNDCIVAEQIRANEYQEIIGVCENQTQDLSVMKWSRWPQDQCRTSYSKGI